MNEIVLAVTGASAQVLAERSLDLLLRNDFNVRLVMSKGSYEVWKSEIGEILPVDPLKQE